MLVQPNVAKGNCLSSTTYMRLRSRIIHLKALTLPLLLLQVFLPAPSLQCGAGAGAGAGGESEGLPAYTSDFYEPPEQVYQPQVYQPQVVQPQPVQTIFQPVVQPNIFQQPTVTVIPPPALSSLTVYPLPECYTGFDGYMCCNNRVEDVMYATYDELFSDGDNCNMHKVATEIQQRLEASYNTTFEVIAGIGDFASRSHFYRNYICKVLRNDRYLLAYATPLTELEPEANLAHLVEFPPPALSSQQPSDIPTSSASPMSIYPLPECYTGVDGFMCCNNGVADLMYATYDELFNAGDNCNMHKVATEIQDRLEATYNTTFEVIAGIGDFASRSHFYHNYICKVLRNDRFLLAYATPQTELELEANLAHRIEFRRTRRSYLLSWADGTETEVSAAYDRFAGIDDTSLHHRHHNYSPTWRESVKGPIQSNGFFNSHHRTWTWKQ